MANYLSIHLYLDDEDETQLFSLYDVPSNPFSLGDKVYIRVEDIWPADYKDFKPEYGKQLMADNNALQKLVDRKWVELVREGKYVDTKVSKPSRLTIEYHCKIVEK